MLVYGLLSDFFSNRRKYSLYIFVTTIVVTKFIWGHVTNSNWLIFPIVPNSLYSLFRWQEEKIKDAQNERGKKLLKALNEKLTGLQTEYDAREKEIADVREIIDLTELFKLLDPSAVFSNKTMDKIDRKNKELLQIKKEINAMKLKIVEIQRGK